MKRVFSVISLCLGLTILLVQLYNWSQPKRNVGPSIPDWLGTPLVLSSTDLVVQHSKGEAGDLVGETLQIEADVVKRTDPDTLEMKTMAFTVFCKYKSIDAPEGEALKPGDRLIVTGRADGYFANRLFLKSCRFAPRSTALDAGWEIIKVP